MRSLHLDRNTTRTVSRAKGMVCGAALTRREPAETLHSSCAISRPRKNAGSPSAAAKSTHWKPRSKLSSVNSPKPNLAPRPKPSRRQSRLKVRIRQCCRTRSSSTSIDREITPNRDRTRLRPPPVRVCRVPRLSGLRDLGMPRQAVKRFSIQRPPTPSDFGFRWNRTTTERSARRFAHSASDRRRKARRSEQIRRPRRGTARQAVFHRLRIHLTRLVRQQRRLLRSPIRVISCHLNSSPVRPTPRWVTRRPPTRAARPVRHDLPRSQILHNCCLLPRT